MEVNRIITGDNRETIKALPDSFVQCCVTSPPYWGQRCYGGGVREIGQEETPQQYVETLVGLFREVKRILRDDGTFWLNLGDKFSGSRAGQLSDGKWIPRDGTKQATNNGSIGIEACTADKAQVPEKNLIGLPWRVALALQADGWILRCDCIWHKPNVMPGSQQDRPTVAHEYLFLFAKRGDYFYDNEAIKEPAIYSNIKGMDGSGFKNPQSFNGKHAAAKLYGSHKAVDGPDSGTRTKRSVWTIPVASERDSHFAVFPHKLVEPCIMAGTSERGQCVQCGSPWERVVESEVMEIRRSDKGEEKHAAGLRTSTSGTMVKPPTSRTTGWQPTCKCGTEETEPQIVFDPFGGSGTTAQTARHLGRRWLICELNEEYAKIAERKIRRNPYGKRPKVEKTVGQSELFT